MLGEYPIKIKGRAIGMLKVSQEGLKTRFKAECRHKSAEVLRLAAISGDRYVILGVMMPEGEQLTLSKSYSKNDLAGMGLDGIEGTELLLADDTMSPPQRVQKPEREPEMEPESERGPEPEPEKADEVEMETPEPETEPEPEPDPDGPWSYLVNPGLMFEDEILAESCQNVKGAMSMEGEDGILLAIPAERDEPFPLMPIFCFGTWDQIKGKNYIIFKIKDGNIVE